MDQARAPLPDAERVRPRQRGYRVSCFAHEGRHFSDNHRFPSLDREELTELATAEKTLYDLLESFSQNTSDDLGVPHSYANGRAVRDLAAALAAPSGGPPVWREVPGAKINAAARDLLRADTRRLATR